MFGWVGGRGKGYAVGVRISLENFSIFTNRGLVKLFLNARFFSLLTEAKHGYP